jgi:hypothetical protein
MLYDNILMAFSLHTVVTAGLSRECLNDRDITSAPGKQETVTALELGTM